MLFAVIITIIIGHAFACNCERETGDFALFLVTFPLAVAVVIAGHCNNFFN